MGDKGGVGEHLQLIYKEKLPITWGVFPLKKKNVPTINPANVGTLCLWLVGRDLGAEDGFLEP